MSAVMVDGEGVWRVLGSHCGEEGLLVPARLASEDRRLVMLRLRGCYDRTSSAQRAVFRTFYHTSTRASTHSSLKLGFSYERGRYRQPK